MSGMRREAAKVAKTDAKKRCAGDQQLSRSRRWCLDRVRDAALVMGA